MQNGRQPVHPGIILLEQVMKPLGISRNQLARDIDVPVGRISDITNGKRGITADTALRLAQYFGTEAELWVRLQGEYDLHVARTTKWPAVQSRVRVMRKPQADAPPPQNAPANPGPGAVQTPHETVARLQSAKKVFAGPPVPAAPAAQKLPEPSVAVPPADPAEGGDSNQGDSNQGDSNQGDSNQKELTPPPPDLSEPYLLTNPLDELDAAAGYEGDEEETGELLIPPLPRD